MQVRARTFFAESQGEDVAEVEVPVVGGHAGVTILPLFSQASPFKELPHETAEALTRRTQDGGTEVVQAKAGKACAPPRPRRTRSHGLWARSCPPRV
jgi:malate dehydrogenase